MSKIEFYFISNFVQLDWRSVTLYDRQLFQVAIFNCLKITDTIYIKIINVTPRAICTDRIWNLSEKYPLEKDSLFFFLFSLTRTHIR